LTDITPVFRGEMAFYHHYIEAGWRLLQNLLQSDIVIAMSLMAASYDV
jgi:hypothetical protein